MGKNIMQLINYNIHLNYTETSIQEKIVKERFTDCTFIYLTMFISYYFIKNRVYVYVNNLLKIFNI